MEGGRFCRHRRGHRDGGAGASTGPDSTAGPDPSPAPSVDLFDSGKLLATSGVSQIEGAAGGGLTPWALITGYETRDAIGANAHYTFVHTGSYTLHSTGASIGLFDRVELSYAREIFDTRKVGGKLGLGNGFTSTKMSLAPSCGSPATRSTTRTR